MIDLICRAATLGMVAWALFWMNSSVAARKSEPVRVKTSAARRPGNSARE